MKIGEIISLTGFIMVWGFAIKLSLDQPEDITLDVYSDPVKQITIQADK
jgi:hypothetical protein